MELLAGLALASVVVGILVASYMGAGWLIHPCNMSRMEVFPERFGVSYEKEVFKADDGHELVGWFVPSPKRDARTLIVCHGWGDNKGEVFEKTIFLNRTEGFNLFYFDFRGHGESAPSVVTMGKLELHDLAAAIRHLKKTRPVCAAKLGIFGQSMGAAIAAMALAEHPEIKAAVLESPFADYHTVGGRWAWSHYRIPYYPAVAMLMLWAKWRSGHWDIDTYDPASRIDRATTPALFIAGENDQLMLPDDVRRVYERARGPKDFWIVPGASHSHCRAAAPRDYDSRVGTFLRSHLA